LQDLARAEKVLNSVAESNRHCVPEKAVKSGISWMEFFGVHESFLWWCPFAIRSKQ